MYIYFYIYIWVNIYSQYIYFIAKIERRQAERKCRNTKLTIFKVLYRQAKHKVSKLVHTAKCKFYTEKIALASSSKELHQIVITLSSRQIDPLRILPTIYRSADLPSIFIKHFTNKVEKLRVNIASEHVTSTLVTGTTAATFSSFDDVSQLTVKICILNSPKSCDLDPIPFKLLIECLDSILPSLTDLFTSSLASGIFPQCFKSALVTSILKKGYLDRNDLNNFWPVSNLCFIAKILEKLVLSHVSAYINSHNLYNSCQSACRPGHSTETALLLVYFELCRLASICRFLTSTATATLVSAFVLWRINYCDSLLFDSTHDVTSHLQRIQNYVAWVILCLPKSSSITTQ